MSDTKLKVGILGLGIGRAHLRAYAALGDLFDVQAVCDVSPERLGKVKGPIAFADYAEMLKAPLDIIDICTPPHLHLTHIEQALAAGHHVICEKPLVTSLAEADRVEQAVAASGKTLMPIFQYRFSPGIARLKAAVDAGIAGKPFVATIETHWLRGHDYYSVPWRGKWQSEGGGVWLGHAIHAHDLMRYVLGDVRSVTALAATRVNAIETEDCAAAIFEMQNGALVTSSATLGAQDEMSRLRFCFEHLTAESCRSAYLPGDEPWTFTPPLAPRLTPHHGYESEQGYVQQFGRLHHALTHDEPPPVTLHDARSSIELVTALYHAWETNARVALPLTPDHPKYHSWQPTLTP